MELYRRYCTSAYIRAMPLAATRPELSIDLEIRMFHHG